MECEFLVYVISCLDSRIKFSEALKKLIECSKEDKMEYNEKDAWWITNFIKYFILPVLKNIFNIKWCIALENMSKN